MFKFVKSASLAAAAVMAAASAHAQVNLTAETGGPGTVVHLAPASLVEYAAERGIANIQLKDGQTSTNYVLSIGQDKVDIGSVPLILPFLLGKGVGPYASLEKDEAASLGANVQLLAPYTLGVYYLYAYDAKGFSSWDDIKGAKILNGPPRGAATTDSRVIIQALTGLKHDEDYESVTVNWGQAASAVVDGTADAAMLPELFPSGRVTQASAAGAMSALSMPKDAYESEAVQKVLRKPGSAPYRLPVSEAQGLGDNWTIISEDDTFRGMAVLGGLVGRAGLDEDLVYDLVTAHIENIEVTKSKAPFARLANFDTIDDAITGVCTTGIQYHPGAARAWEDAGYSVPDC